MAQTETDIEFAHDGGNSLGGFVPPLGKESTAFWPAEEGIVVIVESVVDEGSQPTSITD